MVALQLLVVLSPAYRRPPPGTHPSRFPHPTLHRRTPPAADLLSMVFRIHHPKPPGAGAPAKGKPCLEHLQPPAPTPQSPPPGQRPCLSKLLPRLPRPSGAEGTHHTKAAKVLSMVFGFVAPTLLRIHPAKNQRPCLSELLPHRDAMATPGRPQQPHTAHLLSLDFREMPHNNPPTRPETMLRTFTAQPGKVSVTLLSHTTWAANLISMVFRIHHPKPPGAGAPAKGKPCLAFLLPT